MSNEHESSEMHSAKARQTISLRDVGEKREDMSGFMIFILFS